MLWEDGRGMTQRLCKNAAHTPFRPPMNFAYCVFCQNSPAEPVIMKTQFPGKKLFVFNVVDCESHISMSNAVSVHWGEGDHNFSFTFSLLQGDQGLPGPRGQPGQPGSPGGNVCCL